MAVAASLTVLTCVSRRIAVARRQHAALLAALAFGLATVLRGRDAVVDTFLPLFTLCRRWCCCSIGAGSSPGLVLGHHVVFKQTLVPLVRLRGFVVVRSAAATAGRNPLRFTVGARAVAGDTGVAAAIGVLGDFWFWTVGFNLTTARAIGQPAARPAIWCDSRSPVAIGIASMAAPPTAARGWSPNGDCIATVAGGLGRRAVHLHPAVPFFAILLGMLGVELWRRRATRWCCS